jgi:hypothetical protein
LGDAPIASDECLEIGALDRYLDEQGAAVNAYSLAADLIPCVGAEALQSDNASALTERAFRDTRSPRR